jgi:hypothetical protein
MQVRTLNSFLNNLIRKETQRELTYVSTSLASAVTAMQDEK